METVKNVTIDAMWSLSLVVIGICTLAMFGPKIMGYELPDVYTRIIEVLYLIALPVLGYTTVRKGK